MDQSKEAWLAKKRAALAGKTAEERKAAIKEILAELKKAAQGVKTILTVEMSTGQMVEDVRLAVEGSVPVEFYGRTGGMVPTPDEVLAELLKHV